MKQFCWSTWDGKILALCKKTIASWVKYAKPSGADGIVWLPRSKIYRISKHFHQPFWEVFVILKNIGLCHAFISHASTRNVNVHRYITTRNVDCLRSNPKYVNVMFITIWYPPHIGLLLSRWIFSEFETSELCICLVYGIEVHNVT